MVDGLSVDTSSYPKPPAPVNALDTAAKFQGLQQGAQQLQSGQLTISKQKLDLANQAYGYLNRALIAVGPNATKEQLVAKGQNMVNDLGVPQSMVDHMNAALPDDPKLMPAALAELRANTAEHHEQIQQILGGPPIIGNDGNTYYSIRQPQDPANPVTVQNLGINQQPPPTTPTVDNNPTLPDGKTPNPNYGQPKILGAQPSAQPAGSITRLPPVNGALPVAPGGVNTLPPASGAPMPNARPGGLPIAPQPGAISPPMMPPANSSFNPPVANKSQDRVAAGTAIPGQPPQPTGPATGMPPQFEEGRKQYNDDIQLAKARQSALKPILQAMPLIKQLQNAGPGTEAYTSIIAGLKNFGILPTTEDGKDVTQVQQEVEKKLKAYVQSSPVGNRSDAAQSLREAGTPNPNHQIRPALIKLSQDAVGLDRLAAAMGPAFSQKITNQDGTTSQAPRTDFQNYPTFGASFLQNTDERALNLDTLEKPERQALLASMKKKALAGDEEGLKFANTLRMARDTKLYSVPKDEE